MSIWLLTILIFVILLVFVAIVVLFPEEVFGLLSFFIFVGCLVGIAYALASLILT